MGGLEKGGGEETGPGSAKGRHGGSFKKRGPHGEKDKRSGNGGTRGGLWGQFSLPNNNRRKKAVAIAKRGGKEKIL